MKFPEQANRQTHYVDPWLPRIGGDRGFGDLLTQGAGFEVKKTSEVVSSEMHNSMNALEAPGCAL